MKRTFLAVALMTALISACKTTAPEANPVLGIEGGQVQGVETEISGVYVYKGIPFAAPPVGDLRWKEPQPVIPWDGVKMADTYGPGAYQSLHDSTNPWTSEFYWQDPEYSEDCLYLNVYTKAPGKPEEKLPVAMWIHGGAYTGGWAYEPEFDGKVWGDKGVVLVTINYRLGIFGFMAHPELSAESPHGVSGNYGILDQIAALKWIHNNIAAFGGDPDNIMIFGQSAGAGSVKTLVSSPLTGNLIKKAVIQSGGGIGEPDAPSRSFNVKDLEQRSKEFFESKGYDSLEKLRAASTEQIFADAAGFRCSPVIDGYVSTETFDQAAYAGRIKDIPYMIGYTSDDMGTPGDGVGRFCELRSSAGKPVFEYEFAHALPDDEAGSHDMKGAFHSSELWFVFKSLDRSDRPFVQADWDLAEKIISCWTDFAKTGNPGNGWAQYKSDAPFKMVFDTDE